MYIYDGSMYTVARVLSGVGLPGELKWENGSTSSEKVSWFLVHMASALVVHRTATCKLYDFLMMVSTL